MAKFLLSWPPLNYPSLHFISMKGFMIMRVLESPYVSMRASQVDFKAKALIFVHKDGVFVDLGHPSLGFWVMACIGFLTSFSLIDLGLQSNVSPFPTLRY